MIKLHSFCGFRLLSLLMLAGTSASFGQIITQPMGLTPGEQYRLAFVTDGAINGTSANISTYNAFVLAQADTAPALVALNTTWTAIASTEAVNAITNTGTTGTGISIFSLDGSLVATNYSQLWSGIFPGNIGLTETGASAAGSPVWTGMYFNGTANTGDAMGDAYPAAGIAGSAGGTNAWCFGDSYQSAVQSNRLYAMSDVLTAAPEPNSMALLVLSGIGLAAFPRRRSEVRRFFA